MKTIIISLCLLIFIGCKKEPQAGQITFYTTSSGVFNLYVYPRGESKKYVGQVVKVDNPPACGTNANRVYTVMFPYGLNRYEYYLNGVLWSFEIQVKNKCDRQIIY